ncbi:protein NO VEIN domain-containing protein [Bremerella sp. T1]|uniref:DUF3883 domain-containing protein n=1 Tax=Bremerella sp. TYQ1 TaxID=3119568 RepID=UPI001CCED136|nr:DUF3883 domain-containing protein [Bremerella volcania]UBM35330.1 DUF3883 domain-containing protein [Bremerella volcania]
MSVDFLDDVFAKPMIFFRIGWMERYRGLNAGDTIKGGGSFVEKHQFGFEAFNFLPFDGRVYGWAMPGTKPNTEEFREIALQRIDSGANGDSLDGVVAVWIATAPEGGAYVVGWYDDATIYRSPQASPGDARRVFRNPDQEEVESVGYITSGPASKAVLLLKDERIIHIPRRGKGTFGQANLWYADDPEIPLHREVREKVLLAIQGTINPRRNIGRTQDVHRKQRVESAAIDAVTRYYTENGYDVRSVESDNVGWDLEATLGDRMLRIEVKGLSGPDIAVELTPNEYRMMQKHRQSYRLCTVTSALDDPQLEVFYHSNEWNGWGSSSGLRLTIDEIISARCTGRNTGGESCPA